MRALQAVFALFAMLAVLAVAVAPSPAVGARDPCLPCGDVAPMNQGLACLAEIQGGSVTKWSVDADTASFDWQLEWHCPGLVTYKNLCAVCNYVEVDYLSATGWRVAPLGKEPPVLTGSPSCDKDVKLSGSTDYTWPVNPAPLVAGTRMRFVVRARIFDPTVAPDCDPRLYYTLIVSKPWIFPG